MAGRYGRGGGSFFAGLAKGFASGASDLGSAYWRGQSQAKKEATRKSERQEMLDIQQKVHEAATESQKMSHLLQSTPAEYRAGVLGKGTGWASSPEGQAAIQGYWGEKKQEALDTMKTKHGYAKELARIAARGRGGGAVDPMHKANYERYKAALKTMSDIRRDLERQISYITKSAMGQEYDPKSEQYGHLERLRIRMKRAVGSELVNSRLMGQIGNGIMPSKGDLKRGINLFIEAQGGDPRNNELYDDAARQLGYAVIMPSLVAQPQRQAPTQRRAAPVRTMTEASEYGPGFWGP